MEDQDMIKLSLKDEKASAVAGQVYDRLWSEQGLRTTTADIEIEAVPGAVTLNGRVRTGLLRGQADRFARAGLNGWQLVNNLISDDQVIMDLAGRLATDAATATANVQIDAYLGNVYLSGTVQSEAQRAAVLNLVRQTPHVTKVDDLLSLAR
jgi:osmotically-inducible protein OsmY